MNAKEETNNCVLAMYDVRGIQRYIYHTAKLKDAMGASQLIDNIIMDALEAACKKLGNNDNVLIWDNENKTFTYDDKEKHDIEVLYIGGGNAYVMFCDEKLCIKINTYMSKYIIEHTYSLQLAVAYVKVTSNYSKDYKNIFKEMNKVKANMTNSKPLGALPVMEIEIKTGLPVIDMKKENYKIDKYRGNVSRETFLKIAKKNKDNEENDIDKILDSYARRGIDSRIAVIHIDGNNMALRIRKLIEGIDDYNTAVNTMRGISHNIKYAYLNTFEKMKKKFDNMDIKDDETGSSLVKRFVRKVIVAGDDITYVCNAYIALDTVRYFCEEISKLTMKGGNSKEEIQEYGFSVCAGIAYVNSHFPFSIAYEVAESCCDSAKTAAKNSDNKAYYRNCQAINKEDYNKQDKDCFEKTGNFVDFQICKNVQCKDLKQTRKKEFITPAGELLMQRPYYIPMPFEGDELNKINGTQINNIDRLMDNIRYFTNEHNLPHSLAKDIRNTYHMGSNQINLLGSFLDSRGWKMPGGIECKNNMYVEYKGVKTAAWYDALEIMDYCIDSYIEDIEKTDNIDETCEEAIESAN